LITPVSELPNEHQDIASVPRTRSQIWLARIWLGVKVILFIQAGMMLLIVPWTPIWERNSLVSTSFGLQELLHSGFVRGAISGLGLINIWIGIADAVNYRE
jgi:hypothetical protein